MGRRNREEKLSLVAQQQQEIEAQRQRIEYLEARQVDGPKAYLIDAVEGAISRWIMDGEVKQLTTGDSDDDLEELQRNSATGYELAISDGLGDAARLGALHALESLPPNERLEFVQSKMDEETFTRVAVAGLASMMYRDPINTLAGIPWHQRSKIIEELGASDEIKERLTRTVVRIAAKNERTNVSAEKMQRDYDDYGYIDTSELEVGDKVDLELMFWANNGQTFWSQKGRVVELREAGRFIQPLEKEVYPFNNPFILGRYKNEGGPVYHTRAMPGARIDIFHAMNVGVKAQNYYQIITSETRYIKTIEKLSINGTDIKF